MKKILFFSVFVFLIGLIAQSATYINMSPLNINSDEIFIDGKQIADVATSGDYDDLRNKPDIQTVPTNISEFENDAGYISSNSMTNIIFNIVHDMAFQGWEEEGNVYKLVVEKKEPPYYSVFHYGNEEIITNDIINMISSTDFIRENLVSVELGTNVTSIGPYCFRECTNLQSITIPNTITNINYDAFYGCSSLHTIVLPNSITKIGWRAFYMCTGVENITLPINATTIDREVFIGCSNLKNIIIPYPIISIGELVFQNCTALTNILFEGKYTSEVQIMGNYPWGIDPKKTYIIQGSLGTRPEGE